MTPRRPKITDKKRLDWALHWLAPGRNRRWIDAQIKREWKAPAPL